MSEKRVIEDPAQWRPGDMFEGAYQGNPFSGVVWEDGYDLMAGGVTIRFSDGTVGGDVTGHVTRTVKPIPEPTEPEALVRFASGRVAWRTDDKWLDNDGNVRSWGGLVDLDGAPVAVSLPRWSDEVA